MPTSQDKSENDFVNAEQQAALCSTCSPQTAAAAAFATSHDGGKPSQRPEVSGNVGATGNGHDFVHARSSTIPACITSDTALEPIRVFVE